MNTIYYDNAATTWPKPDRVCREMTRAIRECGGNPGRSAHSLAMAAEKICYDCRCAVSAFFGSTHPENVVFTSNATAALNIAIKTMTPCRSHILISDIEHNSVLRPVCALAGRGCSYSVYPTGEDDETLGAIQRLIKRDTRVVIACHASNICGIRLPVAKIGELCHRMGLLFIVDASQSAGVCDIGIERDNIDALCCPGHKGMYGPGGCGILLFGEKYASSAVSAPTLFEGGSGLYSLERHMPSVLPERYEAGTLAVPAIAGLAAGIEEINSIGISEIESAENALRERISEMLSFLPRVKIYRRQEERGSIILFNVKDKSPQQLGDELNAHGICVRSGLHCSPLAHKKIGSGEDGAVRLSLGMYNTISETEYFWRAMKEIAL